ncbi:MAG: MerR family transcriptional regulator, partial [Lachnospiraceae bacterium]|nr:MerR family transcriptional regulator [Lachnospiraceae bacterium]
MGKKMTSGEFAKKAGVSQKTIRLYDEKGLLKPSDYSEGNYRLYGKEALLVLEKIIALKKIGFSLEEIKEHLKYNDSDDILSVLEEQLQMMEQRKDEIEKSITCIKSAIARSNGAADWDLVSDIIRKIQIDQRADEGHFYALKHSVDSVDWYVRIYDSLNITEGANVLDLGCGFGKLWRNNWEKIPNNTKVFAYDLYGGWAEDFSRFINEQRDRLSEGVNIQTLWGDVEKTDTWDMIKKEKYSLIIAHYLREFLNDREKLLERASSVLNDNGMFTMSGSD